MTGAGAAIDTSRLESYLAAELDVEVSGTEVVHDGLNLSIVISTEADGRAFVLRRPNKFRDTESFNDLRGEYGVMERLQETPVPAPEPVLLCADESVLGDSFFVMSYLDGETIPLGSNLPEQFRTPSARETVATLLVDSLAEIHSLETAPFADVCRRETARDQLDRIIDQFEEATEASGRESPVMWEVADWLRENVPAESKTALVHGDFRPSNVLFAGEKRPEITGVLDWETAFLGDPLTELGYLLLRWRDEGDPTPSLDELRDRYSNEAVLRDLEDTNAGGLAPFTSEPGSPSRRELVSRYEEATGLSFENERFYRAFAAFVLATVWEDLHRYQVEAEEESDWEPYIDYMAMVAERIASGEFEL